MTKTITAIVALSIGLAGVSHSAQAKSSWSKAPTVQTAGVKWGKTTTDAAQRSSWG